MLPDVGCRRNWAFLLFLSVRPIAELNSVQVTFEDVFLCEREQNQLRSEPVNLASVLIGGSEVLSVNMTSGQTAQAVKEAVNWTELTNTSFCSVFFEVPALLEDSSPITVVWAPSLLVWVQSGQLCLLFWRSDAQIFRVLLVYSQLSHFLLIWCQMSHSWEGTRRAGKTWCLLINSRRKLSRSWIRSKHVETAPDKQSWTVHNVIFSSEENVVFFELQKTCKTFVFTNFFIEKSISVASDWSWMWHWILIGDLLTHLWGRTQSDISRPEKQTSSSFIRTIDFVLHRWKRCKYKFLVD